MQIAWLTDVHLNFVNPPQFEKFMTELRRCSADRFIITGDIGDAPRVAWYLKRLADAVQRPIYFVLGNHDYYMGSFRAVGDILARLTAEIPELIWLTRQGIVELAPGIGLVGHDSWADGRYGSYDTSPVILNDFLLIQDLTGLKKAERLRRLNALGDAAAAHFRQHLPTAMAHCQQVVIATHVPPWREACWHQGRVSSDDYLPHYACQAVGDALIESAQSAPQTEVLVLCGHTHEARETHMLPNLRVLVGGAEYGMPSIQRILDL